MKGKLANLSALLLNLAFDAYLIAIAEIESSVLQVRIAHIAEYPGLSRRCIGARHERGYDKRCGLWIIRQYDADGASEGEGKHW